MNCQSTPRKPQRSTKNWITWVTRRLSIRQKIGCGYALALSIAVLGTTFGVGVGNHYEQWASRQEEEAKEEISLLNRLRTSSLQTQVHLQQFIYLVKNQPAILSKEKSHFLGHAAEFKQLWLQFHVEKQHKKYSEIRDSLAEIEATKKIIQAYKNIPEAYLLHSEEILKPIDLHKLSLEDIEAIQKRLFEFTKSPEFLKFNDFSDSLNELIKFAEEEYNQAQAIREAAHTIGMQIIVTSVFLSVVLAVLLAIYTSRAIARPIQSTTKVAQQVTQEGNFDLQAPVITEDEVGALTTSLNQLIQRVKQLLEEQKAANEAQLIQSEKMSSLGRMMAGVAHEINNPINFIYGNVIHASEYVEDLLSLLETYTTQIPHPPQVIQDQVEEIDLEFLKEDLPQLLQSMRVGAERTKQIVLSLKDFSRLDEAEVHFVNLHTCIDSTLIILNNRIKKDITVIRNYGDIPMIEGYAGLLYQVFMNLLSNALDALEEPRCEKQIVITTEPQDTDWVIVKIADNGSGISPEKQVRMFEAFFTTKPRGVGTGLGLAISRQIVEEKHGGKISCQSEMEVGTEFAIALPIKHPNCIKLPNKNYWLATTSA